MLGITQNVLQVAQIEGCGAHEQRPDKGATPLLRADQPLVKQAIDRAAHRHRADLVALTQLRFRRQSIAGAKRSGGNLLSQNTGELVVGRLKRSTIDLGECFCLRQPVRLPHGDSF